ncbi:putative gastrointestinal growth factor xP1 [Oculina patagonica]
MKTICVVVLAVLIVAVTSVPRRSYEEKAKRGLGEKCGLIKPHRKDCGKPGITKEECEANGCCYDNVTWTNAPWCFYRGSCDFPHWFRGDCGFGRPGITKEECEELGCCWDDSLRGTVWCFRSRRDVSS